MDPNEEKLKKYMIQDQIQGEHLTFKESCHSVAEAAKAAHAKEEEFVKNICMIDDQNRLIVAIVKGEDRASTTRVKEALNAQSVRLATPAEILERTGYPCGGTPSFGYDAEFLIDERVMAQEVLYSGGGSEKSLVKITSKNLIAANKGRIVRVRK